MHLRSSRKGNPLLRRATIGSQAIDVVVVAMRSWRWVSDRFLTASHCQSLPLQYRLDSSGTMKGGRTLPRSSPWSTAHGTSTSLLLIASSHALAEPLSSCLVSKAQPLSPLFLRGFLTTSPLSRGRDTLGVEWPSRIHVLIRHTVERGDVDSLPSTDYYYSYCRIASRPLSFITNMETPR